MDEMVNNYNKFQFFFFCYNIIFIYGVHDLRPNFKTCMTGRHRVLLVCFFSESYIHLVHIYAYSVLQTGWDDTVLCSKSAKLFDLLLYSPSKSKAYTNIFIHGYGKERKELSNSTLLQWNIPKIYFVATYDSL